MVIVPPAELCLQAGRGGEGRPGGQESVPAWEERSPSEDWSGLGAGGLPRTGPEVP